jgi:cytidine deaminase
MREDDVVTNNLEATYKVKVQAYATALLAAYGDAGTESTNFRLVVHSRKIALTGVNCEASSEQVTAITAQSAIGSMKSRKPGHGS